MTSWLPLIAAALLVANAPIAAAPSKDIAALAWLSGNWRTDDNGRWTEERWAPPRGGVMLGTNLSGEGKRAGAFEFMRIAPDESGAISFWGSPGGAPAVAFPLVSATTDEIVFVNPAHDYPTRIQYRRTTDGLTATVSGPDGANPQSWFFRPAN